MKDFLRRAFTENAALKAVALILAITLFILVRGDEETEQQVLVGVAYAPRTDGARIVGNLPSSIELRVRGPWTRIKRLDPSSLSKILIDLDKAREGDFPIEESLIALPPGIRVASIKPSKIAVEFEREKEVPITPVFSGAAAEGFRVDKDAVQLTPARARLHGARSALDPVIALPTAPIALAGRSAKFEDRVALAPLPPGVAFVGDPVLAVDAKVRIVEQSETLTLGRVPVVVRGIPGAATVEPPSVEVVLRGRPTALATLDESGVVAIVELHAEDVVSLRPRPAKVVIEGIPSKVAVEVHPREVTLTPLAGNRPPRTP